MTIIKKDRNSMKEKLYWNKIDEGNFGTTAEAEKPGSLKRFFVNSIEVILLYFLNVSLQYLFTNLINLLRGDRSEKSYFDKAKSFRELCVQETSSALHNTISQQKRNLSSSTFI